MPEHASLISTIAVGLALGHLLLTVGIVIVGKSAAAFLLVLLCRRPAGTALLVAASLAQIGEFSFILAALGVGLGILSTEAQTLIVAGALISIALNPLAFRLADLVRLRSTKPNRR